MEALIMPPEIAEAIIFVLARVKTLVKDNVNKHGGYKYVSYDNFLAIIGPLLAEAGLIIVMNESESHSDGKWLHVTFQIYLYHSSGKHYGPISRTQAVMANGPQAYASAQSFVEKYFMRQTFKIPTGEELEFDADTQSNKEPVPPSKPKATKDQLMKLLDATTSKDALLSWAKDTSDDRAALPLDQKAILTKRYKELEAKFEGETV